MKATTTNLSKAPYIFQPKYVVNGISVITDAFGNRVLFDFETKGVLGDASGFKVIYSSKHELIFFTKVITENNINRKIIKIFDAKSKKFIVDESWQLNELYNKDNDTDDYHGELASFIDHNGYFHLFNRETYRQENDLFDEKYQFVELFHKDNGKTMLLVTQNQLEGLIACRENEIRQLTSIEYNVIMKYHNTIIGQKGNDYTFDICEWQHRNADIGYDSITIDNKEGCNNILYAKRGNIIEIYDTKAYLKLGEVEADEVSIIYKNGTDKDYYTLFILAKSGKVSDLIRISRSDSNCKMYELATLQGNIRITNVVNNGNDYNIVFDASYNDVIHKAICANGRLPINSCSTDWVDKISCQYIDNRTTVLLLEKNGKYRLFTKDLGDTESCETYTTCEYKDKPIHICSTFFAVPSDNGYSIINVTPYVGKQEHTIIEHCDEFEANKNEIKYRDGDKWGLTNGKDTIPAKYTSIEFKSPYFIVKNGNYCGVLEKYDCGVSIVLREFITPDYYSDIQIADSKIETVTHDFCSCGHKTLRDTIYLFALKGNLYTTLKLSTGQEYVYHSVKFYHDIMVLVRDGITYIYGYNKDFFNQKTLATYESRVSVEEKQVGDKYYYLIDGNCYYYDTNKNTLAHAYCSNDAITFYETTWSIGDITYILCTPDNAIYESITNKVKPLTKEQTMKYLDQLMDENDTNDEKPFTLTKVIK